MRITYDFSELWRVADRLGAQRKSFTLSRASTISAIEAELIRGREVKLDELESVSGLLAFEGRQILLYIPDQGQNIESVLAGDRDAGKKFHVAHCATLDNMKRSGRFERYIATTDVSGEFKLTGADVNRKVMSGSGRLYVCQNCLNMLNYKQAKVHRTARKQRENFDLGEFFETYSSCFKYLPTRTKVDPGTSTYTADWKDISDNLRRTVNWCCEDCGIDLSSSKHLLHVHHVDGVKGNNARSNLRALCKACHRQQPLHDHMYVPRDEMKFFNELRRAAGLFDGKWETAFKFADPALHGALGMARSANWECPEIAYEISGTGIVTEVAWPRRRLAITLERPRPNIASWRLIDLAEAAVMNF